MSSLDFLDNILSETLTEEEYLQERKARGEGSAGSIRSVLSNVKLFCVDQTESDFYMILSQLKQDADQTGNPIPRLPHMRQPRNP